MKRIHHNLKAWQEAMELVKMIYEQSSSFPAEENYGLKSQIRRAAVSVPSNIAEGAARTGTKEFLQYLSISRGSLSEVETQLLIAKDLGYIKNADNILILHKEKLMTPHTSHLTPLLPTPYVKNS